MFAAELPTVTDWMPAWEDLRDVLVAALAVDVDVDDVHELAAGLQVGGGISPPMNETAPHQPQPPEAVVDPATAAVYKRPASGS